MHALLYQYMISFALDGVPINDMRHDERAVMWLLHWMAGRADCCGIVCMAACPLCWVKLKACTSKSLGHRLQQS